MEFETVTTSTNYKLKSKITKIILILALFICSNCITYNIKYHNTFITYTKTSPTIEQINQPDFLEGTYIKNDEVILKRILEKYDAYAMNVDDDTWNNEILPYYKKIAATIYFYDQTMKNNTQQKF